jgi:molecular chaperone IbpA
LKENIMRSVDFAPLYRSTVGFDRLFSLLDGVAQPEAPAYPPYNIERTGESTYRISMAVAGFDESELTIETKPNVLTVTGKKADAPEADGNAFLYRGIAQRGFERRFHTADYVEVTGASLKNGLLHIELKREIPEALKPRRISIETAKAVGPMVIEAKAA